MPDITMCTNNSCVLRNECFRFRADPNPYRQSYFAENPEPINEKCEHFMKIFENSSYNLQPITKHSEI